jgi:hypothetical protein
MKHEDMSVKASRKRVTAAVTALAAALLGLFMTAAPAWAAPATTLQVSSHSLAADVSAPAVITGKVFSAVPYIKGQLCSSATKNWVHLTMSAGTGREEWCYGFTGTEYFSGNTTWMACAGNNYGYLRYFDPHLNRYETWQFAPGHVIAWSYGVDVDSLTISSWSGGDTCS